MKGRFADPKHLSTVGLSSQHQESAKGLIGWTFFISPGVSRLIGSCFLAFLSPGTKLEFPLILIGWFYRHGHLRASGYGEPRRWSLLPALVAWGRCGLKAWGSQRGALPVGCSLQLKLRDGYRDAAVNHLMLKLAENNLSSSPSCLMLLTCAACLSFPPSLVLTVSSTDTAHKVQHVIWRGHFSLSEDQSFLLHPLTLEELASTSMALVGSCLQGTKPISNPITGGLRDQLTPLLSREALAAVLHCSHLSLALPEVRKQEAAQTLMLHARNVLWLLLKIERVKLIC